jgi:acyl carrier protein
MDREIRAANIREQLVQLIVRTAREHKPKGSREIESSEAILFGPNGALDSLGLVYLIVEIEDAVEKAFGIAIILADQHAMSQSGGPFRTAGTLADYILEQLRGSGLTLAA